MIFGDLFKHNLQMEYLIIFLKNKFIFFIKIAIFWLNQKNEEDSFIGLLDIRNTPLEKNILLPVEQLIGRITRSYHITSQQRHLYRYAEWPRDWCRSQLTNRLNNLIHRKNITNAKRRNNWKEGKVLERIFSIFLFNWCFYIFICI